MKNNNKILEELTEICPSLNWCKNTNLYSVPFSYFDSFAETVVEKIKNGTEGEYYFTAKNPYSIPADYFKNFLPSVLRRIDKKLGQSEIVTEIEEIAPLLNRINKETVYTVPDDYFSKVVWGKDETLAKKGKIISFASGKKLVSYAVAAAIIGLLAVGIFLFTGKQDEGIQGENGKPVSEVKKLSEQEIIDFLKTTSATGSMVTNHDNNSNKKDSDIKSVVREMSDKEIQRFLEENGEQDEM